jgi:hypothetical protein
MARHNYNLANTIAIPFLTVALLGLVNHKPVLAQTYDVPQPNYVMPAFGQPATGQGYYNYGYQYGNQNMLWDDRVLQRQLELTQQQRRDLIELKIQYDDEFGDLQLKIQQLQSNMYRRLENGSYEYDKETQKQVAKFQQDLTQLKNDAVIKSKTVLLPHQKQQMVRISSLKMIQSRGFTNQLVNGTLATHLELTAEQKKKLQAKKRELEIKMGETIVEMLKDSHEEMLRQLTADQRRQAEEVLDLFEYSNKNSSSISMFNYEPYFLQRKPKKD